MSAKRRDSADLAEHPLDDIDHALVRALQANGRSRVTHLAGEIGLSVPAITDRLRRLEHQGVVTGYQAQVDPKRLGYEVCAVIRVAPGGAGVLPTIAEAAANSPEVEECVRVTGDDCFIMTVYLKSLDDLEEFLDRFTPYGRTTTSIVHSRPVPRRPLPPAPPHRSG